MSSITNIRLFLKTDIAKNIGYVSVNSVIAAVTLTYVINDNNKVNKMRENKKKLQEKNMLYIPV